MKNRKNLGFTFVEILIVVVIFGLLAAIAIPAFQKIRADAQDRKVMANLHELSERASRYFSDNGVSTVESSLLMSANSTQGTKIIPIVAGETYSSTITKGEKVTATGVGGIRTVIYANN